MDKNTQKIILTTLFSEYNSKHEHDMSYIDNYSFGFLCLTKIESLSDKVNPAYKPHELLNYLCDGGYLKEDKVKYYFTEKGYKLSWKLSRPIHYFFSNYWQWAIGTVALGIVTVVATALSN